MNLSPRNKLILVVVAAVVVVLALGGVLIYPAIARISAIQGDIATARTESEAAQTLLEQRYHVKNQAAQTDARLLELAVAVPENPDLPTLIIDLQDTAYESGVVLRSVTPGPPIVPEGQATYVGLPISLEAWGSWADMIDFVDRLEKLPRQLRVNKFENQVLPLPTAEEVPKTGLSFPPYYQVKSTMVLTAYVIPAPSAPTSAAVPAATPPATPQ